VGHGDYLGDVETYAPCLSSIDCLFEEKAEFHGVDDAVTVRVHLIYVEG
jgi:hypothetical protein